MHGWVVCRTRLDGLRAVKVLSGLLLPSACRTPDRSTVFPRFSARFPSFAFDLCDTAISTPRRICTRLHLFCRLHLTCPLHIFRTNTRLVLNSRRSPVRRLGPDPAKTIQASPACLREPKANIPSQDPVQRQAPPLAPHQAQPLSVSTWTRSGRRPGLGVYSRDMDLSHITAESHCGRTSHLSPDRIIRSRSV